MTSSTTPWRCLLAGAAVLALCSCTAQGGPPAEPAADSGPAQAEAARPDPTGAPGDRLPDLTMLPLQSFHVAYEGEEKVLRFTADVLNDGDGPMDVTGVRPSVLERDLQVTQDILRADGSTRTVETDAVMRHETMDEHNHFHVQEFERYRIRPENGAEWRGSRKEGFCLRDDGNLGGTPSRYDDENFYCGEGEEHEILELRQGLTEGWVDSYDWYYGGQFIELEGLELPGDFCVEAEADPGRLFVEETRENNRTSTLVRVTESEATVLREGC